MWSLKRQQSPTNRVGGGHAANLASVVKKSTIMVTAMPWLHVCQQRRQPAPPATATGTSARAHRDVAVTTKCRSGRCSCRRPAGKEAGAASGQNRRCSWSGQPPAGQQQPCQIGAKAIGTQTDHRPAKAGHRLCEFYSNSISRITASLPTPLGPLTTITSGGAGGTCAGAPAGCSSSQSISSQVVILLDTPLWRTHSGRSAQLRCPALSRRRPCCWLGCHLRDHDVAAAPIRTSTCEGSAWPATRAFPRRGI